MRDLQSLECLDAHGGRVYCIGVLYMLFYDVLVRISLERVHVLHPSPIPNLHEPLRVLRPRDQYARRRDEPARDEHIRVHDLFPSQEPRARRIAIRRKPLLDFLQALLELPPLFLARRAPRWCHLLELRPKPDRARLLEVRLILLKQLHPKLMEREENQRTADELEERRLEPEVERRRTPRREHGRGRVRRVEVLRDDEGIGDCCVGVGVVDGGQGVVGRPVVLRACGTNAERAELGLDLNVLEPYCGEW